MTEEYKNIGGNKFSKLPREVLGLSATASESEIKTAYRRLVREHHPDTNPGDKVAEEKFKEVSDAYAKLTQKNKPEVVSNNKTKSDAWVDQWNAWAKKLEKNYSALGYNITHDDMGEILGMISTAQEQDITDEELKQRIIAIFKKNKPEENILNISATAQNEPSHENQESNLEYTELPGTDLYTAELPKKPYESSEKNIAVFSKQQNGKLKKESEFWQQVTPWQHKSTPLVVAQSSNKYLFLLDPYTGKQASEAYKSIYLIGEKYILVDINQPGKQGYEIVSFSRNRSSYHSETPTYSALQIGRDGKIYGMQANGKLSDEPLIPITLTTGLFFKFKNNSSRKEILQQFLKDHSLSSGLDFYA